jgi:hypothetical protein
MTASGRDVEYLLHKGTYRLKALTPLAKQVFLRLLEVPAGEWVSDAFLCTTQERFPALIERLHKAGLTTEAPPPVLGPPPTHLWEF